MLPPVTDVWFPDPHDAGADGIVAIGGDLSVPRLLAAYDHGIFPWYDRDTPPLWWSPDPRAVIEVGDLHVSRSLARSLRSGRFRVTLDADFPGTIRGCADRPEGTWILPEMITAYEALHEAGHAHSVEVWVEGQLAGGLYGVHRGALFAAESMFHRVTDASKIALVHAVRGFAALGIELFEVQMLTTHLASLGASEIPRTTYLARVAAAVPRRVHLDRSRFEAALAGGLR
ncbi:MAG: leucyl/phenylalanyl-tRNA--protein transferase [Deltaproteobacteria bacterium]|nr:leucyl/phenylalanyl-tRNA--protein transferase [Deltaproteobacteria bacterium]